MDQCWTIPLPPPYCRSCNRKHEAIPWTKTRKVYRCNGCNTYGGSIERTVYPYKVSDPEPAYYDTAAFIEELTEVAV